MQNSLQRIDGCITTTAVETDTIISNIQENNKLGLTNVVNSADWRENTPIALVGGGPSLKHTLKELAAFKYVMACGSVHDFLVKNNVLANWCVLCDPDPLILNYMKLLQDETKYLIASQCSPDVFRKFQKYKEGNTTYYPPEHFIWHAGGDNFPLSNFGDKEPVLGGGCTVATRAMIIAHGMGFNNIHLFGIDTCLEDENTHHAYEYETKEEKIGNLLEVKLGSPINGKTFLVADYMLGQLFDFKMILEKLGDKIKFTVHGGGVLDYTIKYYQEVDKSNG